MATKKIILTVSAVIAAMVFGNLVQKAYGAEEPSTPAEKQKRVEKRHRSEHRAGRSDRVGQRMASLNEQLNLTDEQQNKIRPIIEKEMKDIQALRTDATLSKEEKIEKMKGIRQATQEEINKVLTPEQQTKLTEAKTEMKDEAKNDIAQIVQQRVTALSERLNLSDEQKQKIQPIIENEMKEMSALRDDGTLSREQRLEKMKTIRQTSREEINKVLTPEQKAKLEETKPPREPRRAKRRITDENDKN